MDTEDHRATEAEAQATRLKGSAEADVIRAKADAWAKYTAPAISEILIERLPDIAAAVSAPLGRIDRIVMVSNGNGDTTGVEPVTQGVTNVLAQIPGVSELLKGLNLEEVVRQVPGTAGALAGGNGQEERGCEAQVPGAGNQV